MSQKKNKLVKAWVQQHINDPYVNQAQQDGFRSRAAYKLLEIDKQDAIFDCAKLVIDLGCAPGSWSQVAISRLTPAGMVIGVDLLPIKPLAHLQFIQGDFAKAATLGVLLDLIGKREVDVVISDMAPNLTGVRGVDQARSSYLVELVLDFACEHLKIGGHCLLKAFHGGEFNAIVARCRQLFTQVLIRKPDASRSKSSEVYLLCKSKKAI